MARAFFKARTRLEGLNLAVFDKNIHWKSKKNYRA